MQTAFRATALAACAATTLCATSPSIAGAADYVITPTVEEGEREVDLKFGTAKARDGSRQSKNSLGLGWGATSWWFTEVYAIWQKNPGERHGFDAWEWENKFQLTETGKYPVDIGLLLEVERPKDRTEGYEFRWGPLLQADLTPNVQANLNLLLAKHVRAAEGAPAELGYQWQLKYRWQPMLEFGAQGFGAVGPWRHWDASSEQTHIAGPAVFGRITVGQRQFIKYNAGWLIGLNDHAPRNTLWLQAEYEF